MTRSVSTRYCGGIGRWPLVLRVFSPLSFMWVLVLRRPRRRPRCDRRCDPTRNRSCLQRHQPGRALAASLSGATFGVKGAVGSGAALYAGRRFGPLRRSHPHPDASRDGGRVNFVVNGLEFPCQ